MYGLASIAAINANAAARAIANPASFAPRSSAKPTGHHADGSSVQKHSAGPLYPFIVFERGLPGATRAIVSYSDVTVDVGSRASASHVATAALKLREREPELPYAKALIRAARLYGYRPSLVAA